MVFTFFFVSVLTDITSNVNVMCGISDVLKGFFFFQVAIRYVSNYFPFCFGVIPHTFEHYILLTVDD